MYPGYNDFSFEYRRIVHTYVTEKFPDLIDIRNEYLKKIKNQHQRHNLEKNWFNYDCVKEHGDRIRTAHSYVSMSFQTQPIITYFGLLCGLKELIPSFRHSLGPLTNFPIVKEKMFNNQDIEYPPIEISSGEVMLIWYEFFEYTKNNTTSEEEFQNEVSNEKSFKKYILRKYSAVDLLSLGIYISNYPHIKDIFVKVVVEILSSDTMNKTIKRKLDHSIGIIKETLKTSNIFMENPEELQNFVDDFDDKIIDKIFNSYIEYDKSVREKCNIPQIPNASYHRYMKLLKSYPTLSKIVSICCTGALLKYNKTFTPLDTLTISDFSHFKSSVINKMSDLTVTFFKQYSMKSSRKDLEKTIENINSTCSFVITYYDNHTIDHNETKIVELVAICSELIRINDLIGEIVTVEDDYKCYIDRLFALLHFTKSEESNTVQTFQGNLISFVILHFLKHPKSKIIDLKTELYKQYGIKDWIDNFEQFISEDKIFKSFWQLLNRQDVLVSENVDENSKDCINVDKSRCLCIGISQQFLVNILKTIPKDTEFEYFCTNILPLNYGITTQLSKQAKQHLQSVFNQYVISTSKDLPVAFNINHYLKRKECDNLTESDEMVLKRIEAIEFLDDVELNLNWHVNYSHYLGRDINNFILKHGEYAKSHNIRLVTIGGKVLRFPFKYDLNNYHGERLIRLVISNFILDFIQNRKDKFHIYINKLNVCSNFDKFVKSKCPSEFLHDFNEQILSKVREGSPEVILIDEYVNEQSSDDVYIIDSENEDSENSSSKIQKLEIPGTNICNVNVKLEQKQNQKQVIKEIQENEFGLMENGEGVKEISSIVKSLHLKTSRFVKHLSSDLYSNPCHFILELLQNADDNQYLPNQLPMFQLNWFKSMKRKSKGYYTELILSIYNNEIGFSEKDVRSLCDIGASTKTDRNKIGRKGIGFKSVFLVSTCPEIHSNGYHIRFNLNLETGNNGLVPEWIENCDCNCKDGTLIKLKIRDELTDKIQDEVNKELCPELLLFLRQIRSIKVNTNHGEIINWARPISENDEIRTVILQSGESLKWYVKAQNVYVTATEKREITIAIPLIKGEIKDQRVFAYLPLRSVGLRFLVNADFQVPASREDISRGNPWNNKLIEGMANALTDLLCSMPNNKDKDVDIISFLSSIPLPGELPYDSAFSQITPLLYKSLRDKPIIPTENGEFVKPANILLDFGIFNKNQLAKLFGLNLPLADLLKNRRISDILENLGCQTLSLEHALDLLQKFKNENLKRRPNEMNEILSGVVIAIHEGLLKEYDPITFLSIKALLHKLEVWPVYEMDMRVSLSNKLFYVTDYVVPDYVKMYSDLFQLICPNFLSSFSTLISSKIEDSSFMDISPVYTVLRRFSVMELSPTQIFRNSILPIYNSSITQTRKWYTAALSFIVHTLSSNVDEIQSNLSNVRIPVLTYDQKNNFNECEWLIKMSDMSDMSRVHLPLQILNEVYNPVALLHRSRISYTMLDPCLLKYFDDELKWIQFFTETCKGSSWFYYDINNSYPEVVQLIAKNNVKYNYRLLKLLDKNPSHPIPNCLFDKDWIPTKSCKLLHPSSVLYKRTDGADNSNLDDELVDLFPVCSFEFESDILPQKLGLSCYVSKSLLGSTLDSLFVVNSPIQLNFKIVFKLFHWLARNFSQTVLESLVCEYNINRVLIRNNNNTSLCVLSQELYWTIPIHFRKPQSLQVRDYLMEFMSEKLNLFWNKTMPLEIIYPNLQSLFIDIFKVPKYPQIETLWAILNDILYKTIHIAEDILPIDQWRPQSLNREILSDIYNIITDYFDDMNTTNYGKVEITNDSIMEPGEIRYMNDVQNLDGFPFIPCLKKMFRSICSCTIFKWRTKKALNTWICKLHINKVNDVDFVAFRVVDVYRSFDNCASFINKYAILPILEDEIKTEIINLPVDMDSIEDSEESQLFRDFFNHLQGIIMQCLEKFMNAESFNQKIDMFTRINRFYKLSENIKVTSYMSGFENIRDEQTKFVHIQKIHQDVLKYEDDDYMDYHYSMYFGDLSIEDAPTKIIKNIMDEIICTLLDSDSYNGSISKIRSLTNSFCEILESEQQISNITAFLRSHHDIRMLTEDLEYFQNLLFPEVKDEMDYFVHEENDETDETDENDQLKLERFIKESEDSDSDTQDYTSEELPTNLAIEDSIVTVKEEYQNGAEINEVEEPQIGEVDDEEDEELMVTKEEDDDEVSETEENIVIEKIEETLTEELSEEDRFIAMIQRNNFEAQIESGLIGEYLVYRKLRETLRLPDGSRIIHVDWVNQEKESLKPYDFQLKIKKQGSNYMEFVYLEVKSTTNPNKTLIQLSPMEVQACYSFKDRYHVMLAYHQGMNSLINKEQAIPTIYHIPDLFSTLISDNGCNLYLDVERLLNNIQKL